MVPSSFVYKLTILLFFPLRRFHKENEPGKGRNINRFPAKPWSARSPAILSHITDTGSLVLGPREAYRCLLLTFLLVEALLKLPQMFALGLKPLLKELSASSSHSTLPAWAALLSWQKVSLDIFLTWRVIFSLIKIRDWTCLCYIVEGDKAIYAISPVLLHICTKQELRKIPPWNQSYKVSS